MNNEDRNRIVIYFLEALTLGIILQYFWYFFWRLTSDPINIRPNVLTIVVMFIFTIYFVYQESVKSDFQPKHIVAFAAGFSVVWSVVDIFFHTLSFT